MKRLITTLAILLVVMVAGMTALVLLVNPNDFRAWMIQQVEQRSGYQLALKGELRWHVWPQLSILSGPLTLTAQGASQPLVSAENMRLDVQLFPLLSHQLSIKQVMLKSAVVNLTSESQRQRPANAPVGPSGSVAPSMIDDVTRGWKFDIAHLKLVDGLIIWQQDNGEQLNIRDVNLQLDQQQSNAFSLDFSSRISRNQRELQLQLSSALDIAHYPRQLNATITQLDYQLQGIELPPAGIKGQAAMTVDWEPLRHSFHLDNLQVSANDSLLNGKIDAELGEQTTVQADLSSAMLNLDALLGYDSTPKNAATQSVSRQGMAPVIAESVSPQSHSLLNNMTGTLKLAVDKARWHGLDLQALKVQADSQQGVLQLNNMHGRLAGGEFTVSGSFDTRDVTTKVALHPSLQQVDITPIMQALSLPKTLSGRVSLQGDLSGDGVSLDNIQQQWQGNADITLQDAQFAQLNFLQMIQQAVTRSSNKVQANAVEGPLSQNIRTHVALQNGTFTLTDLRAESAMLNYTGQGKIDWPNKQLDMDFGITVTDGWQGDNELITYLQQTPVPLRLYGPWSAINYTLKVDQLLRRTLRDTAKKRLKNWMTQHPDSKKQQDAQELLKDM